MQKKHYLTISLLLSPMVALSVDSVSVSVVAAAVAKDAKADSKQDAKAADIATADSKENSNEDDQSKKETPVDPKQAEKAAKEAAKQAAKAAKQAENQAAKDAKQAEINAKNQALAAYVHQANALNSVLPAVSPEALLEAAALLDAQADQTAEELVREITAISVRQPELGKEQFNQVVTQALKKVQRELTTVVDPAQRKAVLDKFIAKLYSMHNDAVKKDADNTQKTHLSTDEAKETHARFIAAEQTLNAAILLLASDDQKASMLKDYQKSLTEQSFTELVGGHPKAALATAALVAAGAAGTAVYLYEQGVVRGIIETTNDLVLKVAQYAVGNAAKIAQEVTTGAKTNEDVVSELLKAATPAKK